MLEVAQPQATLRDTLATVVDTTEATGEVPEKIEAPKEDRVRDESGRFVSAEKKEERADKPEQVAKPEAAPEAPAPEYKAPPRPSTWKKELEDHWGRLPKEIHEEIARREADFAKGVSTYKGEYDRLRPIGEALKPYEQMLQSSGLTPDKFIHALAGTHQALSTGNEEQKLRTFAKFAQDYGIPLHKMLIQGEDGKVYLNQQYFQPQQQQQQQGLTREDVEREARRVAIEMEQRRQIQAFLEAKDDKGNPKYPHFDEVKATMDGLLRAGLAQDLPSAYDAALRHPNHSAIFEAMQKQHREAEEAARAKAADEAAKKARGNVSQPRSRTPTGLAGKDAPKGLRESIEAAVDEHSRG